MIDLPWPGLSACAAPQKNAIASEARRNQRRCGRWRISFAKPESATARTRDALVERLRAEERRRRPGGARARRARSPT